MNWRLTLLSTFLFLLAFASAVPFEDPSLTQECANNCTCQRTFYLLAVDLNPSSYDFSRYAVKEIISSLLLKEGNAVMICVSGYEECSYPLTSPTDVFSFLSNYGQYSTGFNTEQIIRRAFQIISNFNDDNSHRYVPLPTMTKKLIIISTGDYSDPGEFLLMAKQVGYEVFGTGYISRSSKVSSPIIRHSFDPNVRKLLSVLRGDVSDFCAIFGFGVSHVLTLDGNAYDAPGFGEYTLFNSLGSAHPLLVQIRQTPRETGESTGVSGATEIRGVVVRTDENEESLEFIYDPSEDILTLLRSGSEYSLFNLDQNNGNGYRYGYTDTLYFMLTTRSPYGGYRIEIYFEESESVYLSIDFSNYGSGVVIFPPASTFGRVEGLCGSYDACPRNDFTLPDGSAVDYDLFYSSKKEGRAAREAFVEQWRITNSPFTSSSSLGFTHTAFEVYKPLPDWKPLTSAPGFGRSKEFCAGLPAVLNDACLFDVGARENLYASWFSHELLATICTHYCENDARLAYDFFEAASFCRPHYCPPGGADLHLTYNTTNLPEISLHGASNPSALFKPAINLGGVYTFRFTANDLCDDQAREIKVTIKCDPAPKVSTLDYVTEEGKADGSPNITARITNFGIPRVHFFASVTPVGNPENLSYSWKAINATLPLYLESEFQYPLAQRLDDLNDGSLSFPTTLRPVFMPWYVGVFTFELAVSDGCQVVTKTLVVDVRCSRCAPAPKINAGFSEVPWVFDGEFYWNNLNLNAYSSFDADKLNIDGTGRVSWKVTAKRGTQGVLVEQEPNNPTQYYAFRRILSAGLKNQTSNTKTIISPKDVEGPYEQGAPFYVPFPPYVIPELFTQTTSSAWYETTQVTTTTVYQNELRENLCSIYLNNPSGFSTSIYFNDPFHGGLASCPGEYQVVLEALDDCFNSTSPTAANDTAYFRLACPLKPRVLLDCPHRVEFDYEDRSFPYVSINGASTHDPNPGAPTNGYHLSYSWALSSRPANSGLVIGSGSRDIYLQPDIGGTFVAELTASNGCNQGKGTATVLAVCTKAAPTSTISADRIAATYDGSNPSYFVLTTSITHQLPNLVEAFWELASMPALDPKIAETGFEVNTPFFENSGAPNTTFYTFRKGAHVVRSTVSDGCQQPVTKQLTLTHNCPSITASVTPTALTVNFDYDTHSFPEFTLDATASGGSVSAFYLMDGGVTQVSSGKTLIFTPSSVGSQTFRFVTSDLCADAFRDVKVTAACPQTPVAKATASSLTLNYGQSVELSAATSTGSLSFYQWTLLSSPYGSGIIFSYSQNDTLTTSIVGKYVIQLTVSDGCKSATTTITVTATCPTVTYNPVATTPTTSVWTNGHFARVDLDGRSSNAGGQPLNSFYYDWEVLEAPLGSIYRPSDETSFTVSETSDAYTESIGNYTINTDVLYSTKSYNQVVKRVFLTQIVGQPSQNFSTCFYPDLVGRYRLALRMTSDENPACIKTSPITVQAQCNQPPSVSAADLEVQLTPNVHTRIYLDASETTDPNQDELTYLWEPLIVENVTLPTDPIAMLEPITNPNSPVASFVAIRGGSYPFRLTVSDGCNAVSVTVTVNAICAYANEIAESGKKQREAEKDMIVAKFRDVELSREAFSLTDSILASTCVNDYIWELVDYDQSMLGQTEAFKGSSGFKAAIAVPVIVGGVIIIAVAILVAMKVMKGGASSSGSPKPSGSKSNDTKMENLNNQEPPATPKTDPEW